MTLSFHSVLSAGLAVLAAALAARASEAPRAAQGPPGQAAGLRVFHVGNSHSHQMHWGLQTLANEAGHAGHAFGMANILGASLIWIWEHDQNCSGGPYSVSLAPDKSWDAVTLQAYSGSDKEVDCAVRFAGLAYRGNPRCQVFLYTIWPDAKQDWDAPPPGRTEAFTERCAEAIAKAFPHAPVPRVIPTSLVVREVGRLAERGELPGVRNRFSLQADGGHLSDLGSYVINLTVCAMLYDESPLKYPNHVRNHDRKLVEFPKETAEIIKGVVWDVLTTCPAARVKHVGLVVADRSLPPGIVGQPYKAALRALGASGPCQWRLAGGRLPIGVALDADGTIAGRPAAAGTWAVAIGVRDGRSQAERALKLHVSQDAPPRIVEPSLPETPLDEYFFRELKATGGVGRLTWQVDAAELPHGMMFLPHGVLVGTPGEAGEFAFTVRLSDSHPAGPRSDQREVRWKVLPAAPETLWVRPCPIDEKQITIDGKLEEAFWKLDQPIAKAVAGKPVKKAAFDAVWGKSGLYVAVRVLDGPAGRTPRDALEVFIDGAHNREVMYNADDSHFAVDRSGKARFIRTGDPWWFLKSAAAEAEGGYVVEMRIGAAYFLGQGTTVLFGQNAAYGFDIAVNEGAADAGRQVWRGSDRNPEDPRSFGTIVLAAPPPGAAAKAEKRSAGRP